MDPRQLSMLIRHTAMELGFPICGMSPCEPLPNEKEHLDQWIAQGQHGDMFYMARNTGKRTDPSLLVPGSRTVVSVGMPCFPEQEQQPLAPRIARYALGEDYHFCD